MRWSDAELLAWGRSLREHTPLTKRAAEADAAAWLAEELGEHEPGASLMSPGVRS